MGEKMLKQAIACILLVFLVCSNLSISSGNDTLNTPPDQPDIPLGPTTGYKNTPYNYSTSTIDPDGDSIFYLFNWDDDTDWVWYGPYSSGETCNRTHSWTNLGTYQIRVKAKDNNNSESNWSEPLNVTIIPQTLYVGGSGTGNYSSIQDAVDDATNGDTVFVYSGIYYERLYIDITISLIGEDKFSTIIDGRGSSNTIIGAKADFINISGFTVRNSTSAGIYVVAHNGNNISNNIIMQHDRGLYIQDSTYVTAINNIFFSNGIIIYSNGISKWNTHTIENNTVNGRPIRYYKNMNNLVVPKYTGQVLLGNCTNCTVQNLNIFDVDIGIQIGVSSNITIKDNTIDNCRKGINILFSSDCNVTRNIFGSYSGNEYGIYTYGTGFINFSYNNIFSNVVGCWLESCINPCSITYNYFWDCGTGIIYSFVYFKFNITNNFINSQYYGIFFWLSDFGGTRTVTGNIITGCNRGVYPDYHVDYDNFYHNSFINNHQNAYDHWGDTTWDNGYPSGGNYWDDYTGSDTNNDGIGETPYPIPGEAGAKDNYPLVHPHGLISELPVGWSFISLPTNFSTNVFDILVLFNDTFYSYRDAIDGGIISPYIFGWNRVTQSYDFVDVLDPGYGYWVYAYENCSLWTLYYERNFDDFISVLEPGWNIIGVEFDYAVSKYDILVDGRIWSDAVSDSIISNYVFGWDRITQGYTFTDTFHPGNAYWVYAYQPCILKREVN
jgi:parallel beta-helix repeat protein